MKRDPLSRARPIELLTLQNLFCTNCFFARFDLRFAVRTVVNFIQTYLSTSGLVRRRRPIVLFWLIIGAIAGWAAGQIVKGYGFGLIGNIVVGIVGAVIAGWLLQQLGILIGGGILAAIINAIIGAVILLVLVGLIRRTT